MPVAHYPVSNTSRICCVATQGKFSQALAHASQRHDKELQNAGQTWDVLTRHGDYLKPPIDTKVTLYSLTYGMRHAAWPG